MDMTSAHTSKGDFEDPDISRKRKTPTNTVLSPEIVAKKPMSTDDAFGLGETSTTSISNNVLDLLSDLMDAVEVDAVSIQDDAFPHKNQDVAMTGQNNEKSACVGNASGPNDTSKMAISSFVVGEYDDDAAPKEVASSLHFAESSEVGAIPDEVVSGMVVAESDTVCAVSEEVMPGIVVAESGEENAAAVQENAAAQGEQQGENLGEGNSSTHYIEITSRNRNLGTVKVPYKCLICQEGWQPHTGITFEGICENFINTLRESCGVSEEWVNEIKQSIDMFIDGVLETE